MTMSPIKPSEELHISYVANELEIRRCRRGVYSKNQYGCLDLTTNTSWSYRIVHEREIVADLTLGGFEFDLSLGGFSAT